MTARSRRSVSTRLLTHDPLEGEQLLLHAMFGPAKPAASDSPTPGSVLPLAVSAPGVSEPAVAALPMATAAAAVASAPADAAPAPVLKPQHYRILSISLYNEDIERLDRLVQELKQKGHYRANRSQVIRNALAQLDLARVPKE